MAIKYISYQNKARQSIIINTLTVEDPKSFMAHFILVKQFIYS